ncbi:hypothetical protein BGZ58_008495 [Dissophora ornata]|nr:hypothetical protein BGZ58_008495 [Dissophora ornata]
MLAITSEPSGIYVLPGNTLCTTIGSAINILIASSSFTYKKAGNRLLAVWKSPEKGLRGFWAQQEQLESAQDDLQATTTMVRKRSYRSVRHQLFQAFNAVDDNTIYDGRSSKRRVRSAGVTGGDEAAGGEEKHRQEEEQQVDEEKDEGDEEDEEEQGDDGDESEESASQSSEGSEYLPGGAKLQPAIAPASVYYLTGNGSTDCSKKLWTPWINNGEDLAGKVWAYREAICLKAQKLEPLSGSVEKLAINHVYLFDRKDTSSGLYDAIGAAHWAAITSTSLKRLLPKDVIADVASYALDLAQLSYSDAQDSVLDHEGNRDVRKVLNYLLADDFLWKGADYNELELVQHIFDPFLKTFISNIQGSVGPCRRKKGRRMPSRRVGEGGQIFFLQCDFPELKCFVFAMEAKKTAQRTVLQSDLEKVALLLKDAIDNMARQRVDVAKLKVFGMVVVGE